MYLVRWEKTINPRGPMGRRLLEAYMRETAQIWADRARLERAFESRAVVREPLRTFELPTWRSLS